MGTSSSSSSSSDTSKNSAPPQKLFDFKQYFRALNHKDTITISTMWSGSLFMPGTAQIYNKQYWKLPVLYLGGAGLIYGGYYNKTQFKKTNDPKYSTRSSLFYLGAAALYWTSLMDGVVNYETTIKILPAKATIYSALLPGLGQAYIGDYWRIPIYYAGFLASGYLWYQNNYKYNHYSKLYLQASDPDGGYTGGIPTESLKYYRDLFRRYRDYSVLATALIYILQIVDANVFATLSDFDISNDLTMKLSPAVITPIGTYYSQSYATNGFNAIGFSLGFTF